MPPHRRGRGDGLTRSGQAGGIPGPRSEGAAGCKGAALATVQRGVRSPGARSPRSAPAPTRSEVPLPQDLLSLAVCAEAAAGGG